MWYGCWRPGSLSTAHGPARCVAAALASRSYPATHPNQLLSRFAGGLQPGARSAGSAGQWGRHIGAGQHREPAAALRRWVRLLWGGPWLWDAAARRTARARAGWGREGLLQQLLPRGLLPASLLATHLPCCAIHPAESTLPPFCCLHSYGREECVRLLLAAGADVAAKNDKGQTAAEVRASRGW